MVLSPHCRVICKQPSESKSHLLLSCHLEKTFWNFLLSSFKWHMILPEHPQLFLSHTLGGHPFIQEKKLQWENFIRAYCWNLCQERNRKIFQDKKYSYSSYVDAIVNLVVSWLFNALLSTWSIKNLDVPNFHLVLYRHMYYCFAIGYKSTARVFYLFRTPNFLGSNMAKGRKVQCSCIMLMFTHLQRWPFCFTFEFD